MVREAVFPLAGRYWGGLPLRSRPPRVPDRSAEMSASSPSGLREIFHEKGRVSALAKRWLVRGCMSAPRDSTKTHAARLLSLRSKDRVSFPDSPVSQNSNGRRSNPKSRRFKARVRRLLLRFDLHARAGMSWLISERQRDGRRATFKERGARGGRRGRRGVRRLLARGV